VTALIRPGGEAGLPPESRDELLQVIDEETDRLNRFIEGLSTAGAGSTSLASASVDVNDLLRVSLARAETLTRDHHVQVNVTKMLPAVQADAASIVEVLYILIDNASKYAPPGSTVRVSASSLNTREVELSVADEGPGIPVRARAQVFERFYRAPGARSFDPRRKGIGLGLSIARRLVEAQGGRIWIDDAAGQGTTMRFAVPTVASKSLQIGVAS